MSIKAMNWALSQATGDPRTQCLLYVIADCASPEGVCWPSANHMAEKSQQSRATVYRRLSELRDMGLLETFERWIDDDGKIHFAKAPGRRATSPEIRLNYAAMVEREPAKRSGGGDDDGCETSTPPVSTSDRGSSHECDDGSSQGGDGVVSPVRQGSSHCCDDNSNSNQELNQQESPQAPQRGVIVPPLEDFQSAYPIPFTDFERTKSAWIAMTETERGEAITGAIGYASLCRSQPKRNVEDAHRWLRGRKWQGYLVQGKAAEVIAKQVTVPVDGPQGTIWHAVFDIATRGQGFPYFMLSGAPTARVVTVPSTLPDGLIAMATDRSTWTDVLEDGADHRFHAWRRWLIENVPNVKINYGPVGQAKRLRVPFDWPPRKDGTIGQSSDPPDESTAA